ncbi:MAG: diguanylate cyclase [Rhodobacteraceae bacterium]|nr:diguanylate cyclase [Paracoccaceae bacterium]
MTRSTVLVVEDDLAISTFLEATLGEKYRVTCCSNGAQALGAITNSDIDVVLLDVGLPDIDGFELCKRIKATPELRHVPVIFLTGRTAIEDEIKAFEIGGVDFITKPIIPTVLMARVRTHIDLKHSRDTLERLVFVDSLTGLPNRRAFDQAFAREWRRTRRIQEYLSIVMIDVDHFKQYNDLYGHGAGDECLREVASALGRCLQRPADIVARYGGEEFVALLPGTDATGGAAVADAMGLAVERANLAHKGSSVCGHVTISRGVASTVPESDEEPERLLKAADEELYQAKKTGRNRTRTITLPGERKSND